MPALDPTLRDQLATVVGKENRDDGARTIAEAGARAALEALAVHRAALHPHLDEQARALRIRLRARARQLGDTHHQDGRHDIGHLVEECAYEHWHRMLFARFLAENDLLIHPEYRTAVTLAECAELAPGEGARDAWELAARYASGMLPQIFRADDPVLEVRLPPEHVHELERLLASLPAGVFTASDSLGWVYQFWQARRKKAVNASEVKIGADELPAVTQLFTEPYMVQFLLQNTLGAWWWWAGKVDAASSRVSLATTEAEARAAVALPGINWEYLRFNKVEAANVEAASSRLTPIGFYQRNEPIENLSGNLPHWRQDAVTYFVTFRTADSLPQEKLRQWQSEKEEWLAQHPEPHDEDVRREYYERFPERIESWLDRGYGACRLKESALRKLVEDALRYFDGTRYDLDDCVVSANHVHVLVTPRPSRQLTDILHSWKSYTANEINRRIGQSGAFWQKESFDHIVRSPGQIERIRQYIRDHEDKEKRQDAASTTSTIWQPAAGTFEGWPKHARDLKVLDPCCGSGHFLVAAFEILVRFRMQEEGLGPREACEACDAVLRDNLYGLEIDYRCIQIAAFALALAAWKYPGAGGWRPLPPMNLACSGLAISAKKEDWVRLAGDDLRLRNGMARMYDLFAQAPVLGSLIDPSRTPPHPLLTASFEEIQPLVEKALATEEAAADPEGHEVRVAAKGLAHAGAILGSKYTLVATNVPYLGSGKQDAALKDYCERVHPEAKADLATCFVERCLNFCQGGRGFQPLDSESKSLEGSSTFGSIALVTPQNWLFLGTYKKLRKCLLQEREWNVVARLGPKAFQTPMWDFNVALLTLTARKPDEAHAFGGLDASEPSTAGAKAAALREGVVVRVGQKGQLRDPDATIVFEDVVADSLLSARVDVHYGSKPGQTSRVTRWFWEVATVDRIHWMPMESTPAGIGGFTGKAEVCLTFLEIERQAIAEFGVRGSEAWRRRGFIVSKMNSLPIAIYCGEFFDDNTYVIIPKKESDALGVYAFLVSPDYRTEVRKRNQKVAIDTEAMIQVPFETPLWQKVAAEKYPNGLPKPHSGDPTQWLFNGHPRVEAASGRFPDTRQDAASTLQVAVARLLGYRWPRQTGSSFLDCPALGPDGLEPLADEDGIVCVPPVRGERAAADRMMDLLAAAYGKDWHPHRVAELLNAVGFQDHTLEDWLRNGFFEQHCKLFHQRPFIWQVWDGHREGFSALVNYHRLNRKNLESLTYTYLGDWIAAQDRANRAGESGAGDRLAKARALQKKLELILEGEAPYDIFVRWKPLEEQPIGWEPDLDDGVRLNIRPFVTAGVLRWKPNIKWDKDRGKNPLGSPWGEERNNDVHLTLTEKRNVDAASCRVNSKASGLT